MNGFDRRTEGKKVAILKIALGELKAGSFGIKPIREIASAAGVSQVSIYNYFGSKDELLFAAIKSVLDDKLAQYREFMLEEKNFARLVAALMKEEAAIIRFVQACLRQSASPSALQGKVEVYQSSMLMPFLLELMERGKREGVISDDLEQPQLLFYFGMYQREWSRLMGGTVKDDAAETTADGAEAEAVLQPVSGSSPPQITEEMLVRFFFKGLMG
ncbi:TetR/AcrR family transcriptional regulator [Paenibacillus sp. HB172176]|uniref:TetR/AcrR family transcriptional regulator n=1 Tax=Paenibacillus sp. HB172176 TaxID=2493690 RepID=UPI00143C8B6A|nr:TetR/AcrR family transcriptional regulator [Paenibacillus sp. HB172176]